jgi:hypothetical protein
VSERARYCGRGENTHRQQMQVHVCVTASCMASSAVAQSSTAQHGDTTVHSEWARQVERVRDGRKGERCVRCWQFLRVEESDEDS